MNQPIKVLNVSNDVSCKKFDLSKFDIKPNIIFDYITISDSDEIKRNFFDWQKNFNVIRFATTLGHIAYELIPSASVDNYQIKHVDVWENLSAQAMGQVSDKWFSHNIFVNFLKPFLLETKKIKKIQGAVMIIGDCGFLIPLIFIFSRMGFKKISVYDVDDLMNEADFFEKIRSIMGVTVDIVKPGKLTLLPAIYSFCIVHKPDYDPEDLREISYFNFLTPSPIILDMDGGGKGAFLFEEAVALGGEVIPDKEIWQNYNGYFIKKALSGFKF